MNIKNALIIALCSSLPIATSFITTAHANEHCANYISVREYDVTDSAEVGRRIQNSFVPIVQKINGFIAYYVIAMGKNKTISISLFDNEKSAEESAAKGKAWSKKEMADIAPSAPKINNGAVIVKSCQ